MNLNLYLEIIIIFQLKHINKIIKFNNNKIKMIVSKSTKLVR